MSPAGSAPPITRRVVFLGVILVALAWLAVLWVEHADLWIAPLTVASQRVADLAGWQWAALLLGLAASYLFRIQRVYAEWSPRVGARWAECAWIVAMHYALVNVLPMRSGEAGFPWLLWRRWRVPVETAAVSLLRWRLQDASILMFLAAAMLLPTSSPVRGGAVVTLALLAGWAGRWRQRVAMRLRQFASARQRGGMATSLRRIADAVHSPGSGATGWVCGAGTWGAKLLTVGALLSWLTDIDAAASLGGAIAGEIGAALPLQPFAGFGAYEAGVWAGASLHQPDVSAAPLLAAALVAHLLLAALAAVFGVLGWLSARAAMSAPHAPLPSREGSK